MAAAEPALDAARAHAYRDFAFRVRWDGRYVAGVESLSGLTRPAQIRGGGGSGATRAAEGGGARDGTSRTTPEGASLPPITLERGVTHDAGFARWAGHREGGAPAARRADPTAPGPPRRRRITIELYNEAGQKVIAYRLFGCRVSAWKAVPEPDAGEGAIAIQSLELEHEGWRHETGGVPHLPR